MSYKDLEVWKKSLGLAEAVYRITKGFPKDELYSLVSQMRRSAVSISSNIAEGSGRLSQKEFLHFLAMAYGSCCELETQLILARRLEYIDDAILKETDQKTADVSRMLKALIKSLKEKE